MRHTVRFVSLMLLMAVGTGCRSAGESWGQYFGARLRDFDESFLVSVHLGAVGTAQARVGPIATGVGLYLSGAAGKPHWWDWNSGFAWIDSGLGFMQVAQDGVKTPVEYSRESIAFLTFLTSDKRWLDPANSNDDPSDDTTYLPHPHWIVDRFFSIEVGAYAIVGARVGFNLAEFADFVVGWFGVDLIPDFEATQDEIEREREKIQEAQRRERDDTQEANKKGH